VALRKKKPQKKETPALADHPGSGPLGALLSSPALDVRLPTALQVLQVPPGRPLDLGGATSAPRHFT